MASDDTTVEDPDERLRRAKDYVRDALRHMGQHKDAEDEEMVLNIACRVMRSVYGRKLP